MIQWVHTAAGWVVPPAANVAARAMHTIMVAALLTLIASCGVPTDDSVHSIDTADVPSGLLEPPEATDSRPSPEYGQSTPEIYFLGEDSRLVPVTRKLSAQSAPHLLATVLMELSEGPDQVELDAGLSTALSPEFGLRLVELADGQATIELTGEQVPSSANQSTLAVGQIVLSAASVPSVSSVVLTRDGEPVDAPLGDGVLSGQPLRPSSYQNLLAPQG